MTDLLTVEARRLRSREQPISTGAAHYSHRKKLVISYQIGKILLVR